MTDLHTELSAFKAMPLTHDVKASIMNAICREWASVVSRDAPPATRDLINTIIDFGNMPRDMNHRSDVMSQYCESYSSIKEMSRADIRGKKNQLVSTLYYDRCIKLNKLINSLRAIFSTRAIPEGFDAELIVFVRDAIANMAFCVSDVIPATDTVLTWSTKSTSTPVKTASVMPSVFNGKVNYDGEPISDDSKDHRNMLSLRCSGGLHFDFSSIDELKNWLESVMSDSRSTVVRSYTDKSGFGKVSGTPNVSDRTPNSGFPERINGNRGRRRGASWRGGHWQGERPDVPQFRMELSIQHATKKTVMMSDDQRLLNLLVPHHIPLNKLNKMLDEDSPEYFQYLELVKWFSEKLHRAIYQKVDSTGRYVSLTCFRPECRKTFIADKEEGMPKEQRCPCCNVADICRLCNLSGHGEHPCGSIDEASARELGQYKECPGCHTRVHKTGGCNDITCRCGVHFCWLCSQNLAGRGGPADGVTDHFRNGCRQFDR